MKRVKHFATIFLLVAGMVLAAGGATLDTQICGICFMCIAVGLGFD